MRYLIQYRSPRSNDWYTWTPGYKESCLVSTTVSLLHCRQIWPKLEWEIKRE